MPRILVDIVDHRSPAHQALLQSPPLDALRVSTTRSLAPITDHRTVASNVEKTLTFGHLRGQFESVLERYEQPVLDLEGHLTAGDFNRAYGLTVDTLLSLYLAMTRHPETIEAELVWQLVPRVAVRCFLVDELRQWTDPRRVAGLALATVRQLWQKPGITSEPEFYASLMSQVPAGIRPYIILKDRAGFTPEEVAKILGETQAQVKARLTKARSRFSQAYHQAEGGSKWRP